MPKLSKDVAKRFDEWIGGYAEADIMGDGEHIKQHLADELARQKKELVEKIEIMKDQNNNILWNTALDQAIKVVKEI
jgi:hypothetical protein